MQFKNCLKRTAFFPPRDNQPTDGSGLLMVTERHPLRYGLREDFSWWQQATLIAILLIIAAAADRVELRHCFRYKI